MSNVDVMIFDMDLNNAAQGKITDTDGCLPSAPPPSPNSSSRRKLMNFQFPMSKLVDCCEDLVLRQNRNLLSTFKSRPLNMKRKTSDSDECFSSSSSAGTSPGAADCSCSFGKRSRSSQEFQSFSFKSTDISMMELSAAISSSDT